MIRPKPQDKRRDRSESGLGGLARRHGEAAEADPMWFCRCSSEGRLMATTYYHTVNGRLIGETTSGQRTSYLTDALGPCTCPTLFASPSSGRKPSISPMCWGPQPIST